MSTTHREPRLTDRTHRPTALDPIGIRRVFGRHLLQAPEPFGTQGWRFFEAHAGGPRVTVTVIEHPDNPGVEWIHASISRSERTPDHDDLTLLHRAVFGQRCAYQTFAPPSEPGTGSPHARHLCGRADGRRVLPELADNSGRSVMA